MADTSGLPPEGWYPDRPNATRLRHWTGTGWSNEFRPLASAPTAAPPVVPDPVRETTDQARSRRELRAQVGALVQGQPDTPAAGIAPVLPGAPAPVASQPESQPESLPTPTPSPEPEPDISLSSIDRARAAGGYPPIRPQQSWQESFAQNAARTGSSQTLAGWLYAVSPLWIGALLIAGTTVVPLVNPLLVQGGLSIIGFALSFLLARQDVRYLEERGYHPPSLWWVLLPFLYFVVRATRVGARGVAMVVTYLLSFAALVGLLYLAFVGNPALLSMLMPSTPAESSAIPTPVATLSAQERANILTPDGTEAQLRLDLAKTWDVGAVDCVPFPSTEAGVTTTCVVELDGVAYNAGIEVTPDEPGTAFVLTGMLRAGNGAGDGTAP